MKAVVTRYDDEPNLVSLPSAIATPLFHENLSFGEQNENPSSTFFSFESTKIYSSFEIQ